MLFKRIIVYDKECAWKICELLAVSIVSLKVRLRYLISV